MDVQIERATFVGRSGPDEILFACVNDGRYAILENGVAVGVWGRADYAYCLGIYLRRIDRSRDRSAAGNFVLPRRSGAPAKVAAKAC
jgi:hypothetical protein